MREARLPMAYRDSCANLLIPLNRCRYEEYYLPWKCEVRFCLISALISRREGADDGEQDVLRLVLTRTEE